MKEIEGSDLKKSSKKEKKKKNKYKIQDDEISSTSHTTPSWNPDQHIHSCKGRKYLLVKAGTNWLEEVCWI